MIIQDDDYEEEDDSDEYDVYENQSDASNKLEFDKMNPEILNKLNFDPDLVEKLKQAENQLFNSKNSDQLE